jgi:hypothetical protein
MPTRHRTTFEKKKCPDTYQERLRYPGCSLGDKPFESMSRKPDPHPPHPPHNIPVTPVIPPIPVNPFHPRPIIPGEPYDPPYIPKPIIPGVPTPNPPGPEPPGPDPSAPSNSHDDFVNVSKNIFRILKEAKPLEPNTLSLDPEDVLRAQMVEGSHVMHTHGLDTAQDYLIKHGISGTIDPELSNENVLVLHEKGHFKMIFRGTDLKGKKALSDVVADAHIMFGLPSLHSQMQEAVDVFEKAVYKYKMLPDEVLGFSLGGYKALFLNALYNVKTTVFNPHLAGVSGVIRLFAPDGLKKMLKNMFKEKVGEPASKVQEKIKSFENLLGIDASNSDLSLSARIDDIIEKMSGQFDTFSKKLAFLKDLNPANLDTITEKTAHIIRTTDDPASAMLYPASDLFGMPDRMRVTNIASHQDTIQPLGDDPPILSEAYERGEGLNNHSLRNMSRVSDRRGPDAVPAAQAREMQLRAGQAMLVEDMKSAIDKNMSYTEFVHTFNKRRGVDTEMGPRELDEFPKKFSSVPKEVVRYSKFDLYRELGPKLYQRYYELRQQGLSDAEAHQKVLDEQVRLTGARFGGDSAHAKLWEKIHQTMSLGNPFTADEREIFRQTQKINDNVKAKEDPVSLTDTEITNLYNGTSNVSDFMPKDIQITSHVNPIARKFTSAGASAIRFGIDQGVNFASGMLAGELTHLEDPDGKLSEQANLMLTAGQNAAIDTSIGVVGAGLGITGVGVAEAAGTGLLAAPATIAGYEVSNSVGHLMDNALSGMKDRKAAHAISGATSAVAGVGTTVTTAAATLRAAQFLKSSAQAARAASTTVESAEAGTELTSEGAAVTTDIGVTAADIGATAAEGGAGILEGGADAAGIAELTPIPGARIVGGLIMVGTLIAAGIGALFGMNRPDDNWHGIQGATEIKGSDLDNMIKDYNVGGKTANASVYKELTTAKQDSRAIVAYKDKDGKQQVAIQMTPKNLAATIRLYQKDPNNKLFNEDPDRLAIMGLNPNMYSSDKQNIKGVGFMPSVRDGDRAHLRDVLVGDAITAGTDAISGIKHTANQTDFYLSKAYIDTHGNPFKSNSDVNEVAAAGSVDNYNAFTAAVNKYTTAQNNKAVDLTDFNKTYITPQSVLTNEEISAINAVNPNYFKQFKSSVNTLYLQEKQNKAEHDSKVASINNKIKSANLTDTHEDILSEDDIAFLKKNDPDFIKKLDARATKNQKNIQSNAKALNLNYESFLQMNNDLASGKITQSEFNNDINESQAKRYYLSLDNYKTMTKTIKDGGDSSKAYESALQVEAHNQGFLSASDYYSAKKGTDANDKPITESEVRAKEKNVATDYTKNENLAKQAGIYSLDEVLDPMKWTPDKSEIKFAHDKGLTLNAYNNYMKDFADNKAISAWSDSRPMAFNQTDNQDDIDHFEDDLILAGYNPHAYTFTKGDSGVWSFVRDKSVPLARDAEQANKMKYINEVLGRNAVDSVRTSKDITQTISSLMKRAIDMNTYTVSTADVNLQQFWEAYSRPGYDTTGFTQPMYLKETVNPDGSVTETGEVKGIQHSISFTAKQEKEIAKAKSLGMASGTDQDTLQDYEATKKYIERQIDAGALQRNPSQSQIESAYNSVRSAVKTKPLDGLVNENPSIVPTKPINQNENYDENRTTTTSKPI